jgi:hypothetical protein
MSPEDVKKHFGSTYKFRKDTKMSHMSLLNWLKWGYVPLESQRKLELLTNGLLKAEWNDSRNQ